MGGHVEAAGPQDQRDISEVITYILSREYWRPDPDKIALAGISYGAGLSLLGAALDDRVQTAVAMSGWTNVENVFFENSCPNLVAAQTLMPSGALTGRLDPSVWKAFENMILGNESAFRDFAAVRSPDTYIQALSDRGVPLFLSSNMGDLLFGAHRMLDFFERYSGPKRILMNQGVHASAELSGLQAPDRNYVWRHAKDWLRQWLKGGQTVKPDVLVDFEPLNGTREQFTEWPSQRIQWVDYRVGPRGKADQGQLLLASSSEAAEIKMATESIVFNKTAPRLSRDSTNYSIWYYASLPRGMRLCGAPEISFDVTSNARRWQVVASLFAASPVNTEKLISFGATACWNCTLSQRTTRRLQLHAVCEDVDEGLALAVNLYSDLYQPANSHRDLEVKFHYSKDFSLRVPSLVPDDQVDESILV